MFKIQTLNVISALGLSQFPRDDYEVAADIEHPDAMLVRSSDLHHVTISDSVKAVGRAGAGLNNIPVAALTKRGIPVFNTPGANANAVRELVIAGMLLASRHILPAWHYVHQLKSAADQLEKEIEQHKKQFVGMELMGKTVGVIGLGSVGVKVANAALALGMRVIGFDPTISVNRAWELSSSVTQARHLDELLAQADFVTLHVPLIDATKHMINQARINAMKPGAILLNFARDEIVDANAILLALNENKIATYVTDFPSMLLKDHPEVIALPHLGASTIEAEENCAVMIVRQLRDFLEHGIIVNSANFPTVEVGPCAGVRLAIVNENIPNMVAQISSKLATAKLNINSLLNKSRDDIAYNLLDIDDEVSDAVLREIANIAGVIQVRRIIA
jgi:D-3-phosphoglycerate dehydrogenase